ncbi:MAG: polyprenyl synthetase family protein [SAR86 cluster bacterium]|jgi:farnesyl diphosphate synthase|nr:polyprenyl synthetase family protein [SAR86 cluster bacterium]
MGKLNLSTTTQNNRNLESFFQQRVDQFLKTYIKSNNIIDESIFYALEAPGKRVRPTLLYLVSDALSLELDHVDAIAGALETIHTYSLVHDDLPCMDDDDLRRGQPSLHKKYNEATAVLAGDAMQSMAIEMLLDNQYFTEKQNNLLAKMLLETIGSKGMILGQALDIEYESREANESEILLMCELKTGVLIEFCFLAPLTIANATNEKWKRLGKIVGISFQLIDDLLDLQETSENLGKKSQKDITRNKKNYPISFGEKKTDELLDAYKTEANNLLQELNLDEHYLSNYIMNLFNRRI